MSEITRKDITGENLQQGTVSNFSSNLQTRRIYGLGLMALGGFYIVLANVLVQMVHDFQKENISSLTILFSRSAVTTFMASIFMLLAKTNPVKSTKSVACLFVLGLSCVSGVFFMYLALKKIPVGDVTILQFAAPIFTSALSVAFLKQTCSLMDVTCGFFSFVGLLIMTRPTIVFGREDQDSRKISECIIGEGSKLHVPSDDLAYTFGVLYALIAAALVAVFFVLNKILGKQGDIMLMLFYTGLLGMALPATVNILTHTSFYFGKNWETWLLQILIGVLSFVHLMFVAESLQFEDAGPASLIRNADCVYAFILQYTILRVTPEKLTLLGGAIVATSTTTLGIYRYKSAGRATPE